MAEFEIIIDSHTHWGPSLTMGINITTGELLRQQKESGVTHVVLVPFPSTAIESNDINLRLLDETERVAHFVPYHYIREDFEGEDFDPIPHSYYGGKWHWMRGVQDAASNYDVLSDPRLLPLVEKLKETGKPVIFEEELAFTERFVEMAPGLRLIIPHTGLLGGNPLDFLKTFKDNASIYFDTALSSRDVMLEYVRKVGPERILFGSDVPFGTMKSELSKVLSLPLSHADKELLLFRNFVRLTGYRP